jgi:hypothetical protein
VDSERRSMSWYTKLSLQYLDDEAFEIDVVRENLESVLRNLGLSQDVMKDLSDLVSKNEAAFNLHWLSVIEVIAELAKLSPKVSFGVQGRGEDLRCVWVREYTDGLESFAYGPPEDVE